MRVLLYMLCGERALMGFFVLIFVGGIGSRRDILGVSGCVYFALAFTIQIIIMMLSMKKQARQSLWWSLTVPDGGRLACYQFKRLRSFEFIACLVKPFRLLSFIKMAQKKNTVKAIDSKEMAVVLSQLSYEIDKDSQEFVLTYAWENPDKKTQ